MDFSGVQNGAWSFAGGAVAAVVAGLFSWLIAFQNFGRKLEELERDLQNSRQLSASDLLLARTFQQLNEFYGPMIAARAASEGVWLKLRKIYNQRNGKPEESRFRLIDQLPTICEDPVYKCYVDEIMRLAGVMEKLLLEKAALVEGEWPKSFTSYVAHVALMRAAHAGGNPSPGVEGSMADSSMPKQEGNDIDADLKVGFVSLKEKIGAIKRLAETGAANPNTSTRSISA